MTQLSRLARILLRRGGWEEDSDDEIVSSTPVSRGFWRGLCLFLFLIVLGVNQAFSAAPISRESASARPEQAPAASADGSRRDPRAASPSPDLGPPDDEEEVATPGPQAVPRSREQRVASPGVDAEESSLPERVSPAPTTPPTPGPVASVRPVKISRNFVRDDAQVLSAGVTAAINQRVAGLGGKADIFVITRLLEDMALFDQASQSTFKEIIREVDHYRVIVIFIAYNRDRERGIISTNLGHGVWYIVSKTECEEAFGKEDVPLTGESIRDGVARLADHIERYHRTQPGAPAAPTLVGLDPFFKVVPVLLGVIACGGVVWWLARRGSSCPNCGAPLKTRVSISFALAPTGRVAKKTYKCFRCGYSRRKSLLPSAESGNAVRDTKSSQEELDIDELESDRDPSTGSAQNGQ